MKGAVVMGKGFQKADWQAALKHHQPTRLVMR